MATSLEYLALDRRLKKLLHFRYTYTVYNREGEVLSHETAPIEGYTAKSVKHVLMKRFHLQNWSPWTCLPNGTYKRSHRYPRTGERSTFHLERI